VSLLMFLACYFSLSIISALRDEECMKEWMSRIALLYAILTGLWILAFDLLADLLLIGRQRFMERHLVLAVVTVLLLYLLLSRELRVRKRAEEGLRNALEEAGQRQREISALLEGARAVLAYGDFEETARSIFDTCKDLLGARAGYIALLTADGTQNDVVFLEPGELACTADPTLPMPVRGLREAVYCSGKTIYDNDFPRSEWTKFLPEGHARLDNVLFAPLAIKGVVVGLLGLANKPHGFTDVDARMASAFAELVAIALFNSRALESLVTSEERFRSVAQTASEAIISIDSQGNVVFWNEAATSIFGHSADEAIGKPITFVMPEHYHAAYQDGIHRLVSTGESHIVGKTVEMAGLRRDGGEFPMELSLSTWKVREETFFTGIVHDITQRKRSESVLRVSRRFLAIANRHIEMEPLLKEFVAEVQSFTRCAAVGVRLLDEGGNVPYQAYEGFSQRFYGSESPLSLESDQCMCVNVIKGAADPKLPFYTEGGSFYMNGTTRFLATISEEEKGQTRNVCNRVGYESVALVPIRLGERILGLIHVADPQENMIPLEMVEVLERVALQLGIALQRVQAEDALRQAHDKLERRVQVRTAALAKANEELQAEITERKRVGEQLRLQTTVAEGLVEATLALNQSLDLDEVLDRILEQTQRVIPCRAVAVMLVKDTTIYLTRHRGFEDVLEAWDTLETGFPLDAFALLKNEGSYQPALMADAPGDPEWRYAPGFEWVRSYAAVPLLAGEQIIGFLSLFSDQPGFCNQEMTDLVKAFAAHAVVAIQNAGLYEAELRARQTAETLSAASLALTQTLELDTVMDTLLDYLGRLVPYDSASVMLAQDETHLAVRAVRGYECWTDPQEVVAITLNAQASPRIGTLLTQQKSILIPDTRDYPEWEHRAGTQHVRNWLGVPMVADGKVIGVCGLDKAEAGFFTQQHLQLAQALVGQAAVAVQNAWLFDQVRAGRERLQTLSRRLVEIQESERRYVARELHDEAGQALTSLMVGLRLLEREAQRPEAVVAGVAELKRMVDSVLENLHRLAMDLRPASLDHLGLVAALRQYAEAVSDQHGLVVQFETVGLRDRLPSDVESSIYRMVQEALTNVIRHARATRVDVLLEQRDDKLVVIVEDNGVGFDPTAVMQNGRLGLFGVRERAEMLGGRLVLESAAGVGTTLLVEVPYGDPDPHRR
jgi:PAS domain S-box-containing protein